MKKLFIIIALGLFACASTYPLKDFKSKLWKPSVEDKQAQHLDEETQVVETIDFTDMKLEELIMISVDDYIKERKYQELLIKSCATWR
jgi:hypothetical protein